MSTVKTVLVKVGASLQSTDGNTSSSLDLVPVAVGTTDENLSNESFTLEPGESKTITINSTAELLALTATGQCMFQVNSSGSIDPSIYATKDYVDAKDQEIVVHSDNEDQILKTYIDSTVGEIEQILTNV